MKTIKTSQLLHRAKRYLYKSQAEFDNRTEYAWHKTFYVCVACDIYYEALEGTPHKFEYDAVDYLKRDISDRLGYHDTVRDWLENHVGVPESHLTVDAMQAYRLRWMNALIREYQAKGD